VILHAPAARDALLRGAELMTALLRPTLGPVARTVAIAPIGDHAAPEVLDSGATIARRTLQLADPFEDMGAMIVRHLVLRMFEQVGDGTVTAAILTHALLRGATPSIAAGSSPVAIRRGMERGLQIARAELRAQAQPITLASEIAAVAFGAVHDQSLANMIGEIVDSVGPDGAVLFENSAGPTTEYEYVDGIRWNEGYLSHFLLKSGESTARLLNPRILVTDIPVERAEQLIPTLEACAAAGDRGILVIAPEVRDSAVGLLVNNREHGVLDHAMAVKAPSFGVLQTHILEDIAIFTGGRCFHAGWGDSLADVAEGDLGRARHAWATKDAFGIIGGLGTKERIRERISQARAELKLVHDDANARDKLKERIGKLSGATAIIRVGGPSPAEQAEVRLRIEAAVTAARLAVESGVVAGGGAALLGCAPPLEALTCESDECRGMRILARSLAAPMLTILQNAGLEPGPIVHEAHRRGSSWMFDVLRAEWSEVGNGCVVDPLAETETALEVAVSAAASAHTPQALVASRS
jgi:chaperonin GroEL